MNILTQLQVVSLDMTSWFRRHPAETRILLAVTIALTLTLLTLNFAYAMPYGGGAGCGGACSSNGY